PAVRSFVLLPRPPPSTLFPYTTLFRSARFRRAQCRHRHPRQRRPSRALPRTRGLGRGGDHRRDELVRRPRGQPSARRRLSLAARSEEHTSELQSRENLVCRLLLEKKKK